MKALGLYECEITGDERGDIRHLVAVSKFKDNLITHAKIKYDSYPVEVNTLNCPPVGTKSPYYIIDTTNVEAV